MHTYSVGKNVFCTITQVILKICYLNKMNTSYFVILKIII